MAANDRVKTKELKQEFQEMKGRILADLGESVKPPKQFHIIKIIHFSIGFFVNKEEN
jgi:hypothetical protein